MPPFQPAYLHTYICGGLHERIARATTMLAECALCPRACRVNRLAGETGICKTGKHARIFSVGPHFGEETPLVGRHGSGTIFFTNCNLLCNFCQNFDISHQGVGSEVTDAQLAQKMLDLQAQGCHNINLVTPSHVVPQILSALLLAIEDGFSVPLVYNTSAYDTVETLQLLDGIVDIYLPDFKFWDASVAELTCHAPDYPEVARKAIREMYRQVGELTLDQAGIAQYGLLIRHLVLPKGFAGTSEVLCWIARELSPQTAVNIMFQYHPCGTAFDLPELATLPSEETCRAAVQAAQDTGLTRLDSSTGLALLSLFESGS